MQIDTVGRGSDRGVPLIYRQRATILVLLVSLIGALAYARNEKRQADLWRESALQTRASSVSGQEGSGPNARYYSATLIGEDGSRTSLKGKAIQINMEATHPLEIDLRQQPKNRLFLWAILKREDDHFHRISLHPHCSNAVSLELERVSLKGDTADAVTFDAPR